MLFLDSNVAIAVMNKSSRIIEARFEDVTSRETVFLSAVVLFELRFGIAKSGRPLENQKKLELLLRAPVLVLPFENADAEHAADIRADLKRKGTPIGPYDTLIAAQARRHGATLVTHNTREFIRVEGLMLEDWI